MADLDDYWDVPYDNVEPYGGYDEDEFYYDDCWTSSQKLDETGDYCTPIPLDSYEQSYMS